MLFAGGLRYLGTVSDQDPKTGLHKINYDDGVVEWTSISDDSIELISVPGRQGPGSGAGSGPAKRKRDDDADHDDAKAAAGDSVGGLDLVDLVGERVLVLFDDGVCV